MECICKQCGMGVKGLKCAKCNADLVSDTITKKDSGEKIAVAKCPKGCGMIASPKCCNHTMEVK